MNDRQVRTLRSFDSILASVRERTRDIAPEAPAIIKHLAATCDELERLHGNQMTEASIRSANSPRRQVAAMRERLMLPLATLGKRIFAGDTTIMAALRVPHKRTATDVMLAAAERMVKTLRPQRSLLTASSGEAKRITELHTEVRRVSQLVRAVDGAVADRAVPTRRVTELLASARRDVQALGALVAASGNKAAIRDWKSVSRVGGHIGRPKRKRATRRTSAVSS